MNYACTKMIDAILITFLYFCNNHTNNPIILIATYTMI